MRTSPEIKESASLPPATPGAEKAAVNFMEVVYRIVRRIPKGRATSYGAIAEASGIRLTARMVGWAMNAAGRAQPPVPAHRVVNSKGELSGRGHFATPTLMQELLEQEGIQVKNDKIEDWKRVFWDPAEENKAALKPKAAAKPPVATRTTKKSRPAPVSASPTKAKPAPKAKTAAKPSSMPSAAKRKTAAKPVTAKTPRRPPGPKIKKEK